MKNSISIGVAEIFSLFDFVNIISKSDTTTADSVKEEIANELSSLSNENKLTVYDELSDFFPNMEGNFSPFLMSYREKYECFCMERLFDGFEISDEQKYRPENIELARNIFKLVSQIFFAHLIHEKDIRRVISSCFSLTALTISANCSSTISLFKNNLFVLEIELINAERYHKVSTKAIMKHIDRISKSTLLRNMITI